LKLIQFSFEASSLNHLSPNSILGFTYLSTGWRKFALASLTPPMLASKPLHPCAKGLAMNYLQVAISTLKTFTSLTVLAILCSILLFQETVSAQVPAPTSEPRITGIQLQKIEELPSPTVPPNQPSNNPPPRGQQQPPVNQPAAADAKIRFTLVINGEGFHTTPGENVLQLLGADKKNALEKPTVDSASENTLVISGEAVAGTYDIDLKVGQAPNLVSAKNPLGLKIKLELNSDKPSEGVKSFEVKYTTYAPGKQYPNLYTMEITNEGNVFDTNLKHMEIGLLPEGATHILVTYVDPRQLHLEFLAPDKFEVKNVSVTVFNSGDLDARKALYVSEPSKQQAKSDPNQPTIKNTEIVYLDRARGFGRLKIEGTGFGQYPTPPLTSEDYLFCFATRQLLSGEEDRYIGEKLSKSDKKTKLDSKELEELRNSAVKELEDRQKTSLCDPQQGNWGNWANEINKDVKVILVPRNTSFHIDKAQVISISDKLVDVYFEFETIPGYSLPFRLSEATLTITKRGANNMQTLSDKDKKATGTVLGPQTFLASSSLGEPRTSSLLYYYTLLDKGSVLPLFGRGVADNFYVILLSVSNSGAKKVSIPLSSIKAEVEWSTLSNVERKKHIPFTSIPIPGTAQSLIAREGPETIPPVPLSSVTGYFDAYNKTYGKRAKLINFLTGLSTLMTPFTSIFGPGFTQAQNPFNAGVIPFTKTVLPDMSSEQLQRLTSESWSDAESLSAGGGHVTKYVFIPRGEAFISTPNNKDNFGAPTAKQIKNILGLDVIGFEITEGATVQATGGGQSSPTP
jgi:hypothetical protein